VAIRITFQDGRTVGNCESLVLTFCQRDFSYRNYDLVAVPQDNLLTLDQIRLANRIVARMPIRVAESLWRDSTRISHALSRVPASVGLTNPNDEIPWDGICALFDVCMRPGTRTATATKVLHKKRPELIPILDSVVAGYLSRVSALRLTDQASEARWATKLTAVAKRNIDNNLDGFYELQDQLDAKGYALSVVRLYDILFWGWSGEYSPAWQGGAIQSISTPAGASGRRRPMPEHVKEKIRQANIKYWSQPKARERMRRIQLRRWGKQ